VVWWPYRKACADKCKLAALIDLQTPFDIAAAIGSHLSSAYADRL
jgi:hypothetical protein